MFNESDRKHIEMHGSDIQSIEKQIHYFRSGFPSLVLDRPATLDNGIRKVSQLDQINLLKSFDSLSSNKTLIKFVPASGAATRMFKSLFSFMEEYAGSDLEYQMFSHGESFPEISQFFRDIENFAFFDDLASAYGVDGEGLKEAHLKHKFVDILKVLLTDEGLNYGELPKGLLKFHQYKSGSRTAAEEHLVEGAHYARDSHQIVRIHFTVSAEHRSRFEYHINEMKEKYENEYSVTFDVGYSEQKSSTDTIAVDLKNKPFRNVDGSLLFRPAGHGALISNLNDLDEDLIFIKNVDNVVPDHLKGTTYTYKKVLAAILLENQRIVFDFLDKIDGGWSRILEEEIIKYAQTEINIFLPEDYYQKDEPSRKVILHSMLNRPIRVCGMVGNIGDPGGGPFWVKGQDGATSLQIVETAQIDLPDSIQKSIFEGSTHFNPADLVCSPKNYLGSKFDISEYSDPMTGFITEKSKDGKLLKALELPGLWNGAMSNWISIFVEIPKITFNPVKKAIDLLNDQHQPRKGTIYE